MTIIERLKNPLLREIWGTIDKKTPVNATQAVGTITFTGAVDGVSQTVTIGDDVYEFDTDGAVPDGRILVDVSGGATASDAVTALVAAITENTTEYTAVDGDGDTVVVTAAVYGTAGNDITTTETCTNGSWGAVTLEDAVDGTPGKKGEFTWDDDYIYVCGTKDMHGTNHHWERTAKASY